MEILHRSLDRDLEVLVSDNFLSVSSLHSIVETLLFHDP